MQIIAALIKKYKCQKLLPNQGRSFFIYVRPAWAQSYGFKSLVCPSSGKDIANGKGVVGDYESEGSRMANLWFDEQKSHQATVKDKAA